MTPTLHGVLSHLDRVWHHFSFEIEQDDFPHVVPWCWASNAILYFPDGTVRDPNGEILIDPQTGEPNEAAELPFPVDARKRKAQTETTLRNRLIDVPETLPPIAGEVEVAMRASDDVAWRALALFVVAVRSESLIHDRAISVDSLRSKSPLAFQALSPLEAAFLDLDHPEKDHADEFAWRYESLYVLQWALGMHDRLAFPDEVTDVPGVAQRMLQSQSAEFVSGARLRSTGEVLDATDMNHRMLWAARNAHAQNSPPPASINGYVLSERQHAFNWLIGFQKAPWDAVDTPT